MNLNRVTFFLVLIQICIPAGGAESRHWSDLQMPEGVDHVKLPLVRADNYLFTRASVNGQDAGWFLIDTGANFSLLSNKTAEKFKLKKLGATNASALGGSQNFKNDLYEIDSISVGGISSGKRLIGSADMEHLPFIGEKICGVIGTDILAEMPFTLDLRELSLTFHRAGKNPATQTGVAKACKLRILNGWPAIEGSIEGNRGWFMVDTGSSGLSLELFVPFTQLHSELLTGKHFLSSVSFGMGGLVESQSTTFKSFSILNQPETSTGAACLQGSSGRGGNIDLRCAGAIGVETLRDWKLTFDFKDCQVWLELPGEESLKDYLNRINEQAKNDLVATAPLLRALGDGRIDAVKSLLQSGTDVNARGLGGATALMDASSWPDALKLLLEKGADVNAKSILKADSSLIWAAQSGSAEAVKLLLKAGADVNYANTLGETALHRAAEANYPEVMELLIEGKANINARTKKGVSVLSMAVLNDEPEALAAILRHRPIIDAQDSNGFSPLMIASQSGNVEALNQLIKAGAKLDLADSEGVSALLWAAHSHKSGTTRALIKAGANASLKAKGGASAWDIAMDANSDDVLQVLRYETPTTKPTK